MALNCDVINLSCMNLRKRRAQQIGATSSGENADSTAVGDAPKGPDAACGSPKQHAGVRRGDGRSLNIYNIEAPIPIPETNRSRVADNHDTSYRRDNPNHAVESQREVYSPLILHGG
jgi:hypothetical protein